MRAGKILLLFPALVLLLSLLSTPAKAFSQYSFLLEEKRVDLLPLLVVPSSCAEFLEQKELFEPQVPAAGAEAAQAIALSREAGDHLDKARAIALAQKYFWLTGPAGYAYYTTYSYYCHAEALQALEKSLKAAKLSLSSLDKQAKQLDDEAGGEKGVAEKLLEAIALEEKSLESGSNEAPIARVLSSAGKKASFSWQNALSAQTEISRAVADLNTLVSQAASLENKIIVARTQLAQSAASLSSRLSEQRALAKNSVDYASQEQLEQVADEWFAFLPAGGKVLTGSNPSFRETLKTARLRFDEAEALALEARKNLDRKERGWLGRATNLFLEALGAEAVSLAASRDAEERSLELEKFLSKTVSQELAELGQKARSVSAANPLGAAFAYYQAQKSSGEYEELAGAPRGVKAREFVRILRELRDAREEAGETTEFNKLVERAREKILAAQKLAENSGKDGVENSLEKEKLASLEAAVRQISQAREEDLVALQGLWEEAGQVRLQLLSKLGKKFGKLPQKLDRLKKLGAFLSEEDRKQLELFYASAAKEAEFGESPGSLEESAGSLEKREQFVEKKLAELQARAEKIVGESLAQDSVVDYSASPAEIGAPAEVELFWSALHEIPLEALGRVEVEIPRLENALDAEVVEKSGSEVGLEGSKIVLASGSAEGARHYARIRARKIVSKLVDAKDEVLEARADKLVRKKEIIFEALEKAAVLYSQKTSSNARIVVESSTVFEKSVVEQEGGGQKLVVLVRALPGRNTLQILEEIGEPVSLQKSIAVQPDKLLVTVLAKNNLDEYLRGMQVEFSESVECAEGEIKVSANAREIRHERAPPLLATRLSGMDFAPGETQQILVQIPCNSLSKYASAKIRDLAANADTPLAAPGEFESARQALEKGDLANAAKLAFEADGKVLEYEKAREKDAEGNAELAKQLGQVQQAGSEIFGAAGNSSLQAAQELSSLGAQIASAAAEGLKKIGDGREAKEARVDLEAAKKLVEKAKQVVEKEIASVAGECNSYGEEKEKQRACVRVKTALLQAREKVLLEKIGEAASKAGDASKVLEEWKNWRSQKIEENRKLLEGLVNSVGEAKKILQNASPQLGASSGEAKAAARELEPFARALLAKKDLEVLVERAEKFLGNYGAEGAEQKIVELDSGKLEERKNKLEQKVFELNQSMEELRNAVEREVLAAERKSGEFGGPGDESKAREARQKLEGGSAISAFALAREVNRQLDGPFGGSGSGSAGWSLREIVLAASAAAILILLAYVFWQKPAGAEEAFAEQQAAEISLEQPERKERRPTVF